MNEDNATGFAINDSMSSDFINECLAVVPNPIVYTISDSLDDEALDNSQVAANVHIAEKEPIGNDVHELGGNQMNEERLAEGLAAANAYTRSRPFNEEGVAVAGTHLNLM